MLLPALAAMAATMAPVAVAVMTMVMGLPACFVLCTFCSHYSIIKLVLLLFILS